MSLFRTSKAPGWERNAPVCEPARIYTLESSPLGTSFLNINKALPPIGPQVVIDAQNSPRSLDSTTTRAYSKYDDLADDLKFAHFDQVINGERRRPIKNKFNQSTWSLASAETAQSRWRKLRSSVFSCLVPPFGKHLYI